MKTAVEWLLNEWQTLETTLPNSLIVKVLEMEKQQIIDAYNENENYMCDGTDGEQYYKATFNK